MRSRSRSNYVGPLADAEPRDSRPAGPFVSEIPKLRKLAVAKGLTGLANNTKWNELLTYMRSASDEQRTPMFRCRCIDSEFIASWDSGWWYHAPLPMLSVYWLDLAFAPNHLEPNKTVSKDTDLEQMIEVVKAFGFDYERSGSIVRIHAYAPRDRSGLVC